MDPPLSARDLVESSLPIAVTLLFWAALSWIGVTSVLGGGARGAGLAMAALVTVAVGLARAPSVDPPAWDDLNAVVRTNARVALAVLVWVVVSAATNVVARAWEQFGLPGLFTSPLPELHWVFGWTAVGTAAVYAVAAGRSLPGAPSSARVDPARDD